MPAPSLPTNMGSSRRAATDGRRLSGTDAVAVGRSGVPPACNLVTSAGPTNMPRSEGLIGVASTRKRTSSAFGAGVATSSSHNSSLPSRVIFERSSSPDVAMGIPLHATALATLERRTLPRQGEIPWRKSGTTGL